MKRLSFVLILLGFLTFTSGSVSAESRSCVLAADILKQVSQIRGLNLLKRVPCQVEDRDTVRGYLEETIKTKIPPGRLKFDEIAFKAIGLIPESYDYEAEIINVYLSQIGGYYDPEKKRFTMAGWIPDFVQTSVAAHELTHALQDQHFDLSSFIDSKLENSDELFARSALVEGDATAAMHDFMRKLQGAAPLEKEANVNALLMENVLGGSLMSFGGNTPPVLQLILLFPYTSGLRFVHYELRHGPGYRQIDHVFEHPPRSTEEILHPEKYGKAADFRVFSDTDVLGSENTKPILYRETFGEFIVSVLLGGSDRSKAASVRAATGWGGDRFLLVDYDDAHYKIVWLTAWDTEHDAEEFRDAFKSLLQTKDGATVLSPKRTVTLSWGLDRTVRLEAIVDKSIG